MPDILQDLTDYIRLILEKHVFLTMPKLTLKITHTGMKKILLPLLLLLVSISVYAQPANDDCSGIIDLGTIPSCPDTVWYTNVDATEGDIGYDNFPFGCDGGDFAFVGRDVWFQFNTNDTLIDINIEVTGINDPMGSTPMSNPQVALYRGDCSFDNLSLVKCGRAGNGENIVDIDALGLDPNTTYFLRINDWSATANPNAGTFQLCIGEQDPIFTICGDGSTECSGILYDCGGPDEDYGNNENESFTICPPAPMDGCVTFNMEYFNIENSFDGDVLTFYDGPDISSPIITDLGTGGFGGGSGGGGVCFSVQASSGCLTVGFSSNGTTTFEGFCGAWECSSEPCSPPPPIEVDATITDEELAEFVTTAQTLATITNIACPEGSYGTFIGEDTELGLERGIVLTSGTIANTVGPNNNAGISAFNDGGSDSDLDYLSTDGSLSNDACVVEVDVFVTTDELSFEYIFGSEEYTEFVGSFNDIFAFLVSGPGITGDPNIANQQNIALIPGTTDPVEVNSVNNIQNWEYYRNNENGQSVQYDGLTSDFLGVKKSLTASIPVIPCTTYHLKFAVADRGDTALDSGVFIAELKGGVPNITVNFASGVDYLVENCTGNSDVLLITLDNPLADTASYDVTVSGTATPGVDYNLDIPAQIVLEPGETQLAFPLAPLSDVLTEGIETIIITLTNNFGCGDVELNTVEIEIHDLPLVEIFAGVDSIFACDSECLQMIVEGGAYYEWSSEEPGIFDDPTAAEPVACPTFNQWVYVEGFISAAAGCSDIDSVYLSIVDPQMTITAGSAIDICVGDSVQLFANNNVNNSNIMWTPSDFLNADDIPDPIATPTVTTTYTATVDVSGCTASDSIMVNVDTYDPVNLTTTDTTLCEGSVLQLADSIEFTTTTYEWTPTDYIVTDTDIAGAVSIPFDNIIYTVISTSENAICADTQMVNIAVLPASVEIVQGDYFELCLGDSINLTTLNSTSGVGITWSPDINLDTLEGDQVWATPTETTEYFVTLNVGQCTVIDSITVRVDSMPDLTILPIPDNNPFCEGEVISLTSPNYLQGSFPDLEHVWTPTIGAESDTTNLNLVITATETFTYTRYSSNHACFDTSSIEIIVIDPNEITVTPDLTTICQGEEVQLGASSPDTDEFTWSPSNSLSCEECPDPIATPSATVEYLVEADVMGCPVMGFVTIVVATLPDPNIPVDQGICTGESIQLNQFTSTPDPNVTYSWTSDPPGFVSNEIEPVVSPTVATTYFLTVESQWCDPEQYQVTISIDPEPSMTASDDVTICLGETAELTATGNSTGTYTWTPGPDAETLSVSPDAPGTYVYYTSFTNGCGTVQDSVTVTVVDAVQIDGFAYNPDLPEYNEGDNIEITALTTGNTAGATFDWIFDEQSFPNAGPMISTNFITSDPTFYSLLVTSPDGCESRFERNRPVNVLMWDIPNAFTPDEDGNNDFFNIILSGDIVDMEVREFKIFNRWGQTVYDNDTPLTGWDGTHNGAPAPSDVYIYKIVFERFTGEIVEESGDVTLIR